MAYKGKSKLETLPYKGGSATLEKLPYRGNGEVKMTPLKQEAKRKAVSGVGAKVTKTNRATGETATKKKTLTPVSKSSYSSGAGKKVARKLTKRSDAVSRGLSTASARKEQFDLKKRK